MNDARYYTLGRSGLRVSRLALGTMTFGTEWGWGSPESAARDIFHRYLDLGGNFVDTADAYTGGTSERLVGKLVAEAGARDRVVLATKYTFSDSFNGTKADPNTGGNHRKNLIRALEGSLRRLGTDYVDLYYVHAWDRITPVEEVMRTLDDQVRAGKVRYVAFSDVPAWYAARAQTLAETRGWEPLCALQLEYSLVERNLENEHAALATELGMGLVAWSPLASGLLTGKYKPGVEASGRLQTMKDTTNPAFKKFTPKNFEIVAEVEKVAGELGRPMAQVALAWVMRRPGVGSAIVGATSLAQLETNLSALDLEVPAPLLARLDAVSKPAAISPYFFFENEMQGMIYGGAPVGDKPAGYRAPVRVVGAGAGVT
jgi:aryl-alcohol dehydrogenase-like predicted oxidoreductase